MGMDQQYYLIYWACAIRRLEQDEFRWNKVFYTQPWADEGGCVQLLREQSFGLLICLIGGSNAYEYVGGQ